MQCNTGLTATKFPAYFIALNGSSNIFGASVSKISAATASLLAVVVVFFLVVFFVFGLEALSANMSSVENEKNVLHKLNFISLNCIQWGIEVTSAAVQNHPNAEVI